MSENSESVKHAQLRTLFPNFWRLDSLVRGEMSGISDANLDWTSDEFGWAGWSMRQQTSHMASLTFRWLCIRWGETLFPNGGPISEKELQVLSSQDHDRRLDERVYFDIDEILSVVDRAVELARDVLKSHTVSEGRSLAIARNATDQWATMAKAHPSGVTVNDDGSGSLSLEATFRHIYFEHITHLFNIQRIKRALELPVIVKLPQAGYHTLPDWDLSEAPASTKLD